MILVLREGRSLVCMPRGAELLNAALALPLNRLGILKIYFLLSLNVKQNNGFQTVVIIKLLKM